MKGGKKCIHVSVTWSPCCTVEKIIIIKFFKSLQITNAGGREKGTLLHCWWECKLVQPLWKIVWRYLRKLHIELPYDPAVPLLGIYPDKTFLEKDTCTHMLIAALFTIAKTWKQPKCPSTGLGLGRCGLYTQWNTTQPSKRTK